MRCLLLLASLLSAIPVYGQHKAFVRTGAVMQLGGPGNVEDERSKVVTFSASLTDSDLSDFMAVVDIDDADIVGRALPTGSDLRVATLGGDALPHALDRYTPVVQEGAGWIWFNRPSAVYDAASHKTFAAWITTSAGVVLAEYDHDSGAWSMNTVATEASADDHESPTILLRQDGVVVAFQADHSGGGLDVWIGNTPGQITSVTHYDHSALSSQITYPQAVEFETSGDIMLTWRDGGWDRSYAISTDGGETFSAAAKLFDGTNERPYLHVAQAGDEAHFLLSRDHPREIAAGLNDMYHFYYDDATGTFHFSDGSPLTMPGGPANATLIEDASVNGYNFWGHDIAIGADGRPVVVYAEVRPSSLDAGVISDTELLDHRYRYGRWTGSAWETYEVASSGPRVGGFQFGNSVEAHYSPGMALNHDDPTRLFVSLRDSTGLSAWEYRTVDGGQTWTRESRGRGAFEPQYVRNAHEDLEWIYMAGDYDYWNEGWTTDVGAYPAVAATTARLRLRTKVPLLSAAVGASVRLHYGSGGVSTENRDGVGDASTLLVLGGDLVPARHASPDLSGLTALTVEAVFRQRQWKAGATQPVLSNWRHTSAPAGDRFILRTSDAGVLTGLLATTAGEAGGAFPDLSTTFNDRHHYALRYTGAAVEAFLNGTKSATTHSASAAMADGVAVPLAVGFTPHTGDDLLGGDVYFVRISSVSRSDDWIEASARIMTDPSAYTSVGSEEAP